MKKCSHGLSLAATIVIAVSALSHVYADWISDALDVTMLPYQAEFFSWDNVMARVAEADIKADRAWLSLKSPKEYEAYRQMIRERYIKAIGGFPKKTPLNAKVTETLVFDGYKVDKVLYESHPGVYVTANLYIPHTGKDGKLKFKPPYKAFLVSCGHSNEGKSELAYSRMGAIAANAGFACMVYDPIAQGERMQKPYTMNVMGHYRFGVLAALLGKSMALYRIWDGIRTMDYLDTRKDIDHSAYGIVGNSGGGTMTSLIAAADPRVIAAAPSCYISTISDVFSDIGPQDSEQVIFGQLPAGINHASFVLMGGNAIRVHANHGDFFPFRGTLRTMDVVKTTAENCSLDKDRYALTYVQGRHGWRECARQSTLLWMRRHLAGDKTTPEPSLEEWRAIDSSFKYSDVDTGLGGGSKCNVTAKGDIRELPGFRSVYELLVDELNEVLKTHKKYSPEELSKVVIKTAGITEPEKFRVTAKELSKKVINNVTVSKVVFTRYDGLMLPAVLFRPQVEKNAPVITVSAYSRTGRAPVVAKALENGSAVIAVDLIGTGDIAAERKSFYGLKKKDEAVAAMLYALGSSLVGERATELLAVAKYMKELTGKKPSVYAYKDLVIASAHAYAARRDLIERVDYDKLPLSWAEAVRVSALRHSYAYTVNGALRLYDWPDLLK